MVRLKPGYTTHGVVSYSAARRSREFGIRSTLGASPSSLVRLAI